MTLATNELECLLVPPPSVVDHVKISERQGRVVERGGRESGATDLLRRLDQPVEDLERFFGPPHRRQGDAAPPAAAQERLDILRLAADLGGTSGQLFGPLVRAGPVIGIGEEFVRGGEVTGARPRDPAPECLLPTGDRLVDLTLQGVHAG